MPLPDTIPLRCPGCGCRVRPAPLMREAVVVVRRSCRCGRRWAVHVRPMQVEEERAVHSVEWCELKRRQVPVTLVL